MSAHYNLLRFIEVALIGGWNSYNLAHWISMSTCIHRAVKLPLTIGRESNGFSLQCQCFKSCFSKVTDSLVGSLIKTSKEKCAGTGGTDSSSWQLVTSTLCMGTPEREYCRYWGRMIGNKCFALILYHMLTFPLSHFHFVQPNTSYFWVGRNMWLTPCDSNGAITTVKWGIHSPVYTKNPLTCCLYIVFFCDPWMDQRRSKRKVNMCCWEGLK